MKKVPIFRYQLLLALLLIFCSRLPFLNNGYGAEEDSWGLARIAKIIAVTDVYEASRLPGHPLQEYIYSTIWNKGPFFFNLFTALISTAGIFFFILTLKKFNARQPVLCGLALAFVPIVYINSTTNMDYTWALAFLLASFYFLISGKHFLSGTMLALAIGCRITSAIMIPVYLLFILKDLSENKKHHALRFLLSTFIFSALIYLPAFLTYGIGFLTATDYFPYPSIAKVIYKGSFGVFGTFGIIAVGMILFQVLKQNKNLFSIAGANRKQITVIEISIISILIFFTAYAIKPEKSAYLIPAIPFIILIGSLLLHQAKLILFCSLLIISSFAAGINLEDNLRGSTSSSLAVTATFSGQKISCDLLIGPMMADYYKRKNKITYTTEIANKISLTSEKTVLIAGWWLNEILLRLPDKQDSPVELIFYADENTLQQYQLKQYSIFYLPEQNKWNDLRYQKTFTERYAKAWK